MIGVTEIVSWLGFSGVIFGGDKRQLEIHRVHYPNACCCVSGEDTKDS